MKQYYFEDKTFVIENYNKQKPFANFLPGLAGKKGIPLWAFYVNRGQGISGYGLQDKSRPIMTFTPANKAYESVSTIGFRTFYKTNNTFYEAFKPDSNHAHKMRVNKSTFSIEETNEQLGIKTIVTYFGLPNMAIAGLVRKVEITNISSDTQTLEILDGIAEILPAGIHNDGFKATSNLLASWMDVNHLDENLAFYKLRASTNDSSEVSNVVDGNFYFGFTENERIKPIVDQDLVFGYNLAKSTPINFLNNTLQTISKEDQVTANKVPCGFSPLKTTLKQGETKTLYSISGHTQNIETLRKHLPNLTDKTFIDNKEIEANKVVEDLLKDVETSTAFTPFNEYIKQNYLDNFLRGGYPEKIGNSIYHLYSRRHGDLERDYNYFVLAPEYYSQGAGNFRDVCQNRRMDSFIHTDVKDFNIHHFASLIQLDGYNPLSVNGTFYTIKEASIRKKLIEKHFESDCLLPVLKKPFTPGKIVNTVENNRIKVKTSETEYLNDIINHASAEINAQFGEGYWSDHFTYILDLVESFESIYPDKMDKILYEDEHYAYFDSPVTVLKQHEKTVINGQNNVRQYGSLLHFDKAKLETLNMDPHQPNWAKLNGEKYHSNLYTKLLTLVMNKHSLIDPDGFGIEMEANKPGWNDAMNGVPGLHGSGVSELIETLRIIEFLIPYTKDTKTLALPEALHTFFSTLTTLPDYQGRIKTRESYRDAIRFGLKGDKKAVSLKEINTYLTNLQKFIKDNLKTLFDASNDIIPTFLTYNITKHEPLLKDNVPVIGNYKLPLTKPLEFKRQALANFLEAPARLFKTSFDQPTLTKMHEAITQSDIYDQTLKMYKTSGTLENESHEIGRIRAFTPGWLERESNFLHMNYKYLLGLLKSGLYDAYYKAVESNLVCFMDPAVYGRSTLENSSFIAPSNNPNPKTHGQGFFARLSGSTVETINMWAIMMTGGKPFKYDNGLLTLEFEPKLHHKFFKEDNTLSFTFLKDINVTYINPNRKSTFDSDATIERIELINEEETISILGNTIKEQALSVRNKLFKAIKIYIN